jgi:hypothetical protein
MDPSDTKILKKYLERTKHCSRSPNGLWTVINDFMDQVNGMK